MADQEKKRRKKRKSPWKLSEIRRTNRERLAKKGEAWPLYDALLAEPEKRGTSLFASSPFWGVKWEEEYALLRSALQRRAHDRPEQFAGEILARIMSSATYLWARTSFQVERCIEEFDTGKHCKSGSYLSPGVVNEPMPRLLRLGGYIGEMAQIQAATARQWALARDKSPPEQPATQPAAKKRLRAKTRAESQPAVDVPTDAPTNGTNGAHPPAASVGASDRRIADVVNEGPGHLPTAVENRLERYLDAHS
jgi:hypothetical protein